MAAPVYDNATGYTPAGQDDPHDFSHSCGTGDNRVLYVAVVVERHDTTDVDGVTYNSVSMTEVLREVYQSLSLLVVYRLIAPATGSNLVSIDLDATKDAAAVAISFEDVDQTTPNRTPIDYAEGTSTTPTLSVTSATDELVVDFCEHINMTRTLTVDGSQTERARGNTVTVTVAQRFRVATSTEAGATSVDMDWTISESQWWQLAGLSLKPVSGAGGSSVSVISQQMQ